MNGIGKNIKKLRKERALSQEQLAERLHVTRQAVSSWETGKNQPDIETLESIAAVFDTDILMVLYGRSRQEESGEEKGAQRKRCVRNCLMWGAIALAGLVAHLMVKDKIMDWYYRFCYTVPVYLFVLLVRPLCVFASAVAFMNGLCLIGDIRVRQNWIRRTVLGVSMAFLFLYLAAVFLCMVPVVQDLVPAFLPDPGAVSGWIRRQPFVFSFIVRLVTAPALFLLPGIGMFLGLRR